MKNMNFNFLCSDVSGGEGNRNPRSIIMSLILVGKYGVVHHPGTGKSLGVKISNPVLPLFIQMSLALEKNYWMDGDF